MEQFEKENVVAAISEIRIGMPVFSVDHARIGTVQVVGDDRITILGAPGTGYEGGHYQAALVLIGSVQEGRVVLSRDAEAALILEEAYSETRPDHSASGSSRLGRGAAVVVGIVVVCAVAASALRFMFDRRKKPETRLQQAGEGATTRFGMEEAVDGEVPATGGPSLDNGKSEQTEQRHLP